MIFNEIYSAYYNAVAKIITTIIEGDIDEKKLNKIVDEYAFGESTLTVLPSLKNEKWQLIHSDMTTPLIHIPTMPQSLIQKQWLKAISIDPRIRLFGIEFAGLDGIAPLFTPDDYVIYDKYSDGDPYDSEQYIENFKVILSAIKLNKNIKFEMINRKGKRVHSICVPERLEYSEKDDKFRLVTRGCRFIKTVNLSHFVKCSIYEGEAKVDESYTVPCYDTIVLKVSDERNTLERCMMHFAHFEKRAEKLDNHYLLHIKYLKDDETEMVIRVLSFGPTVEVIESEHFRNLIIERLKKQKSCGLL